MIKIEINGKHYVIKEGSKPMNKLMSFLNSVEYWSNTQNETYQIETEIQRNKNVLIHLDNEKMKLQNKIDHANSTTFESYQIYINNKKQLKAIEVEMDIIKSKLKRLQERYHNFETYIKIKEELT